MITFVSQWTDSNRKDWFAIDIALFGVMIVGLCLYTIEGVGTTLGVFLFGFGVEWSNDE